jgi:hypothetical protein
MNGAAVLPASVSFEMTDAVAGRATRENWRALARRLFPLSTIAITAVASVLFLLAWRSHASVWWVVLIGACPVLMALVVIGWLAGYWWMPRAVRRRLAHLPHRQVTVDFTTEGLAFQTATERLAVTWSEVKAIDPLPTFWLVRLRSGADIPLPRDAIPGDLLISIQSAVSHSGIPPSTRPGSG